MNEELLYFIWQLQYYQRDNLRCTDSQKLEIVKPGIRNNGQGPDFSQAIIRLDGITWVGNVEIHVQTSDWLRHKHDTDKNYQQIILHVVWFHDRDLAINSPTLELQPVVSTVMLSTYRLLMAAEGAIPCGNLIRSFHPIINSSWNERLLIERLERKSKQVEICLNKNQGNWDETFWQHVARQFGSSVNADCFEIMARQLGLVRVLRHKSNRFQLEALFFGQSGVLEEAFLDDYPIQLQREYQYLKHKYKLPPNAIPANYLRMRPSGFPTIRLSQLATLIQNRTSLFGLIQERYNYQELIEYFQVAASEYWDLHYVFDISSEYKRKITGFAMTENILINCIAVFLYTSGTIKENRQLIDYALGLLEQIHAEQNNVIRMFQKLEFSIRTAADSQALLELKHNYCDEKKCLQCSIGNQLLRQPELIK